MVAAKHVLVLIHGMTPEAIPHVMAQYAKMVKAVEDAQLPLAGPICRVNWGVPSADGTTRRPDQILSQAERFVGSLVGLLGFATRPLYLDTPAIVDINMNSGLDPYSAHVGYWQKTAIVDRCIEILRANMA